MPIAEQNSQLKGSQFIHERVNVKCRKAQSVTKEHKCSC